MSSFAASSICSPWWHLQPGRWHLIPDKAKLPPFWPLPLGSPPQRTQLAQAAHRDQSTPSANSSAWGWWGISALAFHNLHFSKVRSNSSDPGQVKSPTRWCHKSKFLMAALSLAPNIWSPVVKWSDDATAAWQLQDSMTLCQK